jgi:hypothetical protein
LRSLIENPGLVVEMIGIGRIIELEGRLAGER